MVPLSLLSGAGYPLTNSERTQGALLGDVLPATDLTAAPAVRLRLLLADPALGDPDSEPPLMPLLTAATRSLGVTVAVARDDGTVTVVGAADEAAGNSTPPGIPHPTPAALLLRDGDDWLAGPSVTEPSETALPPTPRAAIAPRQQRIAQAIDSAPSEIRRRLRQLASSTAPDQTPAWIRGRIRYLQQAELFEERLGTHLADRPDLNDQIGVMTAELFRRADAADRWRELGSHDPSIDGAVGLDRDRIKTVAFAGNLRERMGLLWIGEKTTSDLLGISNLNPPAIQQERSDRLPTPDLTAYEALTTLRTLTSAQHEQLAQLKHTLRVSTPTDLVRPPLSTAEQALMPHGVLPWIGGEARWDLAMRTTLPTAAEATGGLVRAGTSGTTHRLLRQATHMREQWGLDIDLGLVRLALMAEMLPVHHHSLHEIMRASQLVLDDLRTAGKAESPDLDYTDNWGRYWRIAPLTEEELRTHVAVDGLFPDEHALMEMEQPASGLLDGDPDRIPEPHIAAWLRAHWHTLDDILGLLTALGPAAAPAAANEPVTPGLLRRLVEDWFRNRNLATSTDPDEDILRILNARPDIS